MEGTLWLNQEEIAQAVREYVQRTTGTNAHCVTIGFDFAMLVWAKAEVSAETRTMDAPITTWRKDGPETEYVSDDHPRLAELLVLRADG